MKSIWQALIGIVIGLALIAGGVFLYAANDEVKERQTTSQSDSTNIHLKRISSENSYGMYYFEYKGEKFITTSQGGIVQIFNTKEEQ